MKFTLKFPIALLLIAVVFLSSVCFYPANGSTGTSSAQDEPFFGVTFGGNTTSEAKLLIDKVKGYTNLFVVDNWDIAMNETALNEICEYAVDAKLNIMVYFSFILYNYTIQVGNFYNSTTWNDVGVSPFHMAWLNTARERWGNKFLGVYLYDEPGGKQIDKGYYFGNTTTRTGGNVKTFANVSDYSDAANRFVRSVLRSGSMQHLINSSIANSINSPMPVFTSDNALYWFDYLAGYDAVFAELGWNHNQAQHVALCRGAANVQNKQWGAIITWAYNDPPYLASGTQMLEDLNMAYDSGAKYLIVFNYPQINPYGALTEEHFKTMETFWNQIHSSTRNVVGNEDGRVAIVLPKDYGWGMRQPNDKIWGLWPADDLSPQIGAKIATLIKQYGLNLDIIYDDPQFNYTEKYSTIYYWNGTTYQSPQPFFNISAPTALYPSLAIAAIVLTCVPSYFVIKNKKRRTPTQPPSQATIQDTSSSKAILTNLGHGQLELVDNTIKFRSDKGYLRNRKEIIKEIPVTDVESIKQAGSELSLTWKGGTDIFVIEEPALAEKISEKTNLHLEEQKRVLQNRKIMQVEITKTLSGALEIVDSLFDVLRSLQKRIDWTQIESYSNRSEEAAKRLINQTIGSVNLDFSKLLLAVEKHLPKETSKETYDLLRTLYEYFCSLTSKNKLPEEIHPNYKEAKATILAYYTLNDIILSIIVGDKDAQREIDELIMLLEALPKVPDLKIKTSDIKDIINKLSTEKEKEAFIEESRMLFRQFLSHNHSPGAVGNFSFANPK
jgi:hypothetical protein